MAPGQGLTEVFRTHPLGDIPTILAIHSTVFIDISIETKNFKLMVAARANVSRPNHLRTTKVCSKV